MKRLALVLVLGAACTLAACGGDGDASQPVGSAANPAQAVIPDENASTAGGARNNEGSGAAEQDKEKAPNYEQLVESQTAKPAKRFTPCNLVGPAQARAIVGEELQPPVEAPQGPTCIYRTRDEATFVTVAVQRLQFDALRKQMRGEEEVDVDSHTAVCGKLGQSMLYLPLEQGRVLSIGAPCDVAARFARAAVPQLGA